MHIGNQIEELISVSLIDKRPGKGNISSGRNEHRFQQNERRSKVDQESLTLVIIYDRRLLLFFYCERGK
jgi:hypothetical protein